ncbi:hypothetical protein KIN20_008273 [Parelaphostrongylus tenuis]|uniref:Uncharacterized protein n=1 Tax=Parelaphostrongylus tenuis TaxID=148309 RepID=A0AAD5M4J6_PARTN|nr:hypothetical protein KIN20_008273 [Parelaphostrongylus tenuis]
MNAQQKYSSKAGNNLHGKGATPVQFPPELKVPSCPQLMDQRVSESTGRIFCVPLAVIVNQIGNLIVVNCTDAEEAAVRTVLCVVMYQQ